MPGDVFDDEAEANAEAEPMEEEDNVIEEEEEEEQYQEVDEDGQPIEGEAEAEGQVEAEGEDDGGAEAMEEDHAPEIFADDPLADEEDYDVDMTVMPGLPADGLEPDQEEVDDWRNHMRPQDYEDERILAEEAAARAEGGMEEELAPPVVISRSRPAPFRPFGMAPVEEAMEELENRGHEIQYEDAPEEGDGRRRRRVPADREVQEIDPDTCQYGPLDPAENELAVTSQYDDFYEFMADQGVDSTRIIDTSAESEEEAAGMILPRIILDDMDLYRKTLYHVICRMGNKTTKWLRQILIKKQPLSDKQRKKGETWVKYWSSYVVENHYSVLGETLQLPIGPNGAKKKVSATSSMMWEILRLKLLLRYRDIHSMLNFKIRDSAFLTEWLLDSPGVALDPAPLIPEKPGEKAGFEKQEKYKEAMAKYEDEVRAFQTRTQLADIPVMKMLQSQVRRLVQHISSRIEVIPYHEEICKLIEIVEIKTAVFLCRTMPAAAMDDLSMRTDLRKEAQAIADAVEKELQQRRIELARDPMNAQYAELEAEAVKMREQTQKAALNAAERYTINTDCIFFYTCYLYPLMRLVYYAKEFPRLTLNRAQNVETYLPKGSVQRMTDWCVRLATQQKLKFSDRLTEVAADAMLLPGDLDWLAYRYPDESTHVDTVLRKTRGDHAYYDYHTQTELSYHVVLDQVGRSRTSDLYIMSLFNRWLEAYKGTHWMDSYVIHNHYIDDPETMAKWTNSNEPFLIAVFSGFWLMIDGKVLPIKNVIVALCMWMVALRKTRAAAGKPKDCLADNTCITDLLDSILEGKGEVDYIFDTEGHNEYTTNLKRGLVSETTRIQI